MRYFLASLLAVCLLAALLHAANSPTAGAEPSRLSELCNLAPRAGEVLTHSIGPRGSELVRPATVSRLASASTEMHGHVAARALGRPSARLLLATLQSQHVRMQV